jgi:hypothetical protein
MNTISYDPAVGPDIPQGDLLLTWLGHPAFAAAKFRAPEGEAIKRGTHSIRLLEGEITGHHHEIAFGSRHLAHFRDDGLARDLAVTTAPAVGMAKLVEDRELLHALIRSGHWLASAERLCIGFLTIQGGPVDLVHPEHDAWRLPEGAYYVGRQIESAGAEERVVAD